MRPFLILISTLLAVSSFACNRNEPKHAPPQDRIPREDVTFPGMQMRPGADRNSFILLGRVRNRSDKTTITEVTLRMTMEDVPPSGAVTVDADALIRLTSEVPPGESRAFEVPVVFKPLPKPRGRHEWNYAVVEVKRK